ncbi:hypothetical protein GLYMA_07G023200v4 [Glycine max]|uniref:Uncharacterized protein n=1 Tax=Glycine max TaxID=3847 RepID=A0A0R0J958_SOYBN|nr:hypothetical protein GYH30_017170 [Glycine max]KRH47343.1 hypothetical protein GLYMA_07G023200v4 [Glycine max]
MLSPNILPMCVPCSFPTILRVWHIPCHVMLVSVLCFIACKGFPCSTFIPLKFWDLLPCPYHKGQRWWTCV